MKIRSLTVLAISLMLANGLVLSLPVSSSNAQSQENKHEENSWKVELYETDVEYEAFACNKNDSEIVGTFFTEHPLKNIFPICHNDCPVIKCRPLIPFPPVAKAARVAGTVSVHVLVDQKGKVIYARLLSGHPLLAAVARKAACETQFQEYPHHEHQGVMHFTVDGSEYLGVPNRANQVR